MPFRSEHMSFLGSRPHREWVWPVLALALLWWVLAGNWADSWYIGAPAILAGAWLLRRRTRFPRISLRGLARFVPWFAQQSVAGAVDVARRALRPEMPLRPGLVERRTGLPAGAPRIALAQVVGMLPGTLSADLDGRRLVIHALDTGQDLDAMVAELESRIAAVFGVEREPAEPPGESP